MMILWTSLCLTVLGELIVSKFQSKKQIIVGKEGEDLDNSYYMAQEVKSFRHAVMTKWFLIHKHLAIWLVVF